MCIVAVHHVSRKLFFTIQISIMKKLDSFFKDKVVSKHLGLFASLLILENTNFLDEIVLLLHSLIYYQHLHYHPEYYHCSLHNYFIYS